MRQRRRRRRCPARRASRDGEIERRRRRSARRPRGAGEVGDVIERPSGVGCHLHPATQAGVGAGGSVRSRRRRRARRGSPPRAAIRASGAASPRAADDARPRSRRSSGGTGRGCPSSSSATNTKYALAAWTRSPVTGFSASTRTPHSSDVVPTSFTEARKGHTSPTCTGSRNDDLVDETVTQGRPRGGTRRVRPRYRPGA